MGARRGGGKKGHLPPLEIQKYGGPPKDILTRKKFKKIFFLKLSEETELRAPHLVSEESDQRGCSIVSKETDLRGPHIVCEVTYLRGPPHSKRSN